jgi:hypothetical protein
MCMRMCVCYVFRSISPLSFSLLCGTGLCLCWHVCLYDMRMCIFCMYMTIRMCGYVCADLCFVYSVVSKFRMGMPWLCVVFGQARPLLICMLQTYTHIHTYIHIFCILCDHVGACHACMHTHACIHTYIQFVSWSDHVGLCYSCMHTHACMHTHIQFITVAIIWAPAMHSFIDIYARIRTVYNWCHHVGSCHAFIHTYICTHTYRL